MSFCPSCGKEALEGSTKCVFCQTVLEKKKIRWFFKTSSIFMGFLMVGPLILPAVWVNPHYSTHKKWIVTAAILLLTYLLTVGLVKALGHLARYYGEAFNMLNGNY